MTIEAELLGKLPSGAREKLSELLAVRDEQAHSLSDDVDNHKAIAPLPDPPIDVVRWPAGLEVEIGSDQDVTVAGSAAAQNNETLQAGVGGEGRGEPLERIGPKELEILAPLLLAGGIPMPTQRKTGKQLEVDCGVKQPRNFAPGDCLLWPAQELERALAKPADEGLGSILRSTGRGR